MFITSHTTKEEQRRKSIAPDSKNVNFSWRKENFGCDVMWKCCCNFKPAMPQTELTIYLPNFLPQHFPMKMACGQLN